MQHWFEKQAIYGQCQLILLRVELKGIFKTLIKFTCENFEQQMNRMRTCSQSEPAVIQHMEMSAAAKTET